MKRAVLLSALLLCPKLYAHFEQERQVAKLGYGQTEQYFTFVADGEIDDAEANCDCTTLDVQGNKIIVKVNTSDFTSDTERSIDVEMADGSECRLWTQFIVPQAVEFSHKSLIWARGTVCTPITLKMHIPKGSPVTNLLEAGLSGENYKMQTRTITKGADYEITLTPISTAKKGMERLVIKTESRDPKSSQYIIYLRVK